MPYYLIIFSLSCLSAIILTLIVRQISIRVGFVAKPSDDRWHKKATALLGGITIFIPTISFSLVQYHELDFKVFTLLVLSSLMFLVGLFDDIFKFKPYIKLFFQILITCFIVFSGIVYKLTGVLILDYAITFIWFIGITNAFNLLDNMDGLSAGIALIATAFIFLLSYTQGYTTIAFISAGFAGALLGFLFFNFNPASIFMGDCGSLFIGFFLAGLTIFVKDGTRANVFTVALIPALLLLIPIFDTAFVSLKRKFRGVPISKGGRDHASHRFASLGLSERKSVIILYFLSIAGGLAAFVTTYFKLRFSLITISFCLVFLALIGAYLSRFASKAAPGKPNGKVTPLVRNIMYKTQLLEIMLDTILICTSYYLAFVLRFEGESYYSSFSYFIKSVPIILAAKMSVFFISGMYKIVWKYTSIREIIKIFKVSIASSTLVVITVLGIWRFEGFSRTVFIIDFLLLFLLLSFSRFFYRVFDSYVNENIVREKNVLLYGAGQAGVLLLHEILTNKELRLKPIGFIDDDKDLAGHEINGYPVFGNPDKLEDLVQKKKINKIIITTQKISNENLEKIKHLCETNGLIFKRLHLGIE